MPPEIDPNEPNTTPEGDDTGDTGSSPENRSESPNSEAARYRKQLRAAEAERDTARETLNRLQTAEAERLAATTDQGPRLHAGDELWQQGATIADVLGDDGSVNAEAVRALIETVTTDRPHLRADLGPQRPRADHGQGKGNTGKPQENSWGTFIQNGSNTNKNVAATDGTGLRGLFPS